MPTAPAKGRATGAEQGHAPALDGVRGLAILAVLTFHLLISNNMSSSPGIQFLLDVRDQLWMGVTLFFSLSGFLITGILYDTLGTEHYFRTFYGRRVLRIFPLYYGFLGLILVLTPVLHLDWQGQAWRLWTYTGNIPFTQDWVANPSSFINLRHFWSLAVEEQFYLIWPFIVYRLRTWRKILIATLAGSVIALALRLAVSARGWQPPNHSLPFCMDSLLLGGMLALLARSRYRSITIRCAPWIFAGAVAIILALIASHPKLDGISTPPFATIGMSVVSLAATALIAMALYPGSAAETALRIQPLRFLGTYSYGLYVYHYSVDAALTGRLRGWFQAHHAGKSTRHCSGGNSSGPGLDCPRLRELPSLRKTLPPDETTLSLSETGTDRGTLSSLRVVRSAYGFVCCHVLRLSCQAPNSVENGGTHIATVAYKAYFDVTPGILNLLSLT